ncbi:hypothetical protein [Actinokineospora sp. HUAS TT18]|uniref:hypothetical protein n=1 Tax=Actinokineospora sp. HUAS TT18 TaxID=3447451 RepID=UPI003F51BE6E
MRTRVSFTLVGIDASIVEVVPLLVRRWRELKFDDDGVVLVGTERREGLRVESGRHAAAGARYSLVTVGERAGNFDIELVEDSDTVTKARVEQRGDGSVEIEVADRVMVRFAGDVPGSWPVKGHALGVAAAELDALPDGPLPQVHVSVEHSRMVGDAKGYVRGTDGGWRVDLDVHLRGRGVTRVLLGPVLMVVGKRAVREGVEKMAQDLNAVIKDGPLDPVKVADRVAEGFLASVARYRIRT